MACACLNEGVIISDRHIHSIFLDRGGLRNDLLRWVAETPVGPQAVQPRVLLYSRDLMEHNMPAIDDCKMRLGYLVTIDAALRSQSQIQDAADHLSAAGMNETAGFGDDTQEEKSDNPVVIDELDGYSSQSQPLTEIYLIRRLMDCVAAGLTLPEIIRASSMTANATPADADIWSQKTGGNLSRMKTPKGRM